MRSLVFDFDVTILWPLILVALVVLWSSIRTYRLPSAEPEYWRPSENRGHEFADSDAQRKVNDARWHLRDAEWELNEAESTQRRREEKWKAKNSIWFFAAALIILCAVLLLNDRWKAHIAYLLWSGLQYISLVSFIIAVLTAWHYARKVDRLRLGICVLVMLLAAASAEHFFHQTINARHITCPSCSDDDDGPPPNDE